MRNLIKFVLIVVVVIGGYFMVKSWKGTPSWGVGTGNINAGGAPDVATPSKSLISQISENPRKFVGKRVTISGRVRGNQKYAANRNLYRLTDGNDSLVVIDDKSAPKEYWQRSVSGIVKVVRPPLGAGYAYVVAVKSDPKLELKWADVASFFSDKYQAVKKSIKAAE